MTDAFLAQMAAPFFLLACLVIGYPITYFVRHKMKHGWLRRLLLTELDPKKAARERERSLGGGAIERGKR